jgi:hypothetical protein
MGVSQYRSGETSYKKTSGELRVLPTEKHRCDSVSAFAYIQVGRDSGETRLLRFLAGYRHFSAHAKAINEMVRRWIRPGMIQHR